MVFKNIAFSNDKSKVKCMLLVLDILLIVLLLGPKAERQEMFLGWIISILFRTNFIIFLAGLPSHKSIQFDDGIIIDIKFSPVLANVCCVSIHVASFGAAHWCDANIIELSDVSWNFQAFSK